jgi:hypothetical protein
VRLAVQFVLVAFVLVVLPTGAFARTHTPGSLDNRVAVDWVSAADGAFAGRITGTVTGSGGASLSGATVCMWRLNEYGDRVYTYATTDGAGHYDSGVLPGGSYALNFWAPNYLYQVYKGVDVPGGGNATDVDWAKATMVTVASGQVASGIDGQLTLAAPLADTTPPITTVHGADDAWHSAPVTLTLSAEDPGADASGVASTEYKLDAGAWTTGVTVTVPAPPATIETHLVLFRSKDKSGNLEDSKSCSVHINTTGDPPPAPDASPPTTAALGGGDAWHRGPVTVTFTAEDLGPDASGVAYTEYQLDDGRWQQDTSLTVPAPPNASAVHVIVYRSMDKAGNLEEAQTLTVKIDTVEPTAAVLANAEVQQGGRVTFQFRVSDSRPSGTLRSPKAMVKIAIKTMGLKVVKRLTIGRRATNTRLRYTWKCTLQKGTYRFFVYATDAAGNAQARVGSGKLVVK